ncbi:MAG: LOG family protein [Syntrophothermus sp.]
MNNSKKTITVFGSSIPVKGDDDYTFAYNLGYELGLNNFNVCSGGYKGIMEALSEGASDAGADTYGITLDYVKWECNKFIKNEIKCSTLFERITKLTDMGDAYIILKGGTGTLLELAAVWEFMNKDLLPVKPIIAHSQMWMDVCKIIDDRLLTEKRMTGLIKHFENVDEIVEYLKMKLI